MIPDQSPFILTIPSDLCQLAGARAFVTAVCQAVGGDPVTADNLALAAHEAIANVIRHAHRHRAEVPVQIRCLPCQGGIEIHILDEGEPFDLAAVPHLDPAELRVGGRGVFLMRCLTDEITCQRRGERGNVLRLVKRWPAP